MEPQLADLDKRLAVAETKVQFLETHVSDQGTTLKVIGEQITKVSQQMDKFPELQGKVEKVEQKLDGLVENFTKSQLEEARAEADQGVKVKIVWGVLGALALAALGVAAKLLFGV